MSSLILYPAWEVLLNHSKGGDVYRLRHHSRRLSLSMAASKTTPSLWEELLQDTITSAFG